MSQINLMSGGEESNRPAKSLFGGSLFLSIALLVVTFGVYFGVMYYSQSLERSVASHEEELIAKKNLVAGDKANRVADFADRLSVIDENLKKTTSLPNDPLSRIEQSIMPDVNISSYSYDVEAGMVKISLVADSFRSVAQQIVVLKRDNAFAAVSVEGSVGINTDGKIGANLNLSL